MTSPSHQTENIWLAAGVRTPFAKIDGPLGKFDAIAMSVPVVKHMVGLLAGGKPDFAVWGNVVPNLTWSNIAREILMDAGIDPTVPASIPRSPPSNGKSRAKPRTRSRSKVTRIPPRRGIAASSTTW
jgi:hypothetical protein